MIQTFKQWQINESAIVLSEDLDRLLDRITTPLKFKTAERCWTLNNGLIDVIGKVNFNDMKNGDYVNFNAMKKLPFKFGIVHWSFILQSEFIESLEGCPIEVKGDFDIDKCTKITSLKGAPKKIIGDFICSGCKSLKTLEGVKIDIEGDIWVDGCTSLPKDQYEFTKGYEIVNKWMNSGLSLDEFKHRHRGEITGKNYNV